MEHPTGLTTKSTSERHMDMKAQAIIGQRTAAPKTSSQRSAATIHAHALCVLNEWNDEQEKIYCVAAGGMALGDDKTLVQTNLFTVIRDFAGDAVLLGSLRRLINELAKAAGSDYVEGQSHE